MKHFKIVTLAALSLSLVACGSIDREIAKATGYSKSCVEGVSYIQFPSGVTVQYNQDGSVKRC